MTEQFFSDDYILQLCRDGEADIVRNVCPIWNRVSLSVTSGTAVYDLPTNIREIKSVTFKGWKVWPLQSQESAKLFDRLYRSNVDLGRPKRYLVGSDGLFKIRFIPPPDETIGADDSDLFGGGIEDRVIISYFENASPTSNFFSLPDYLARRTVKAYILSKAYLREGKGQNLRAAAYYTNKYEVVKELYTAIKHSYFSRHKFGIGEDIRFSPIRTKRVSLQPGFIIVPPILTTDLPLTLSDNLSSWIDDASLSLFIDLILNLSDNLDNLSDNLKIIQSMLLNLSDNMNFLADGTAQVL